MSQSKVEMAESLSLCFSADINFGTAPILHPLSDEQRGVVQVHSDPGSTFQLSIELDVRLSIPKGRRRTGQHEVVLEAIVHLTFVLTDTTPRTDNDNYDFHKVYNLDYDFDDSDDEDDSDDGMTSLAHYDKHSWLADAMANFDPDDIDRLNLAAAGLILEGGRDPLAGAGCKVDMATERVQKRLWEQVKEAKANAVEYSGPGFEDVRRELDICLEKLTPGLYLRAAREALARLRGLCSDYERSKVEPEA